MPLVDFICPDGKRIPTADCLKEGGCRMPDRCATRSYLQLVGNDRPWTGKPSTTQLIAGTMYAFLKITKDYATSPDSRAFMILGTKAHAGLEEGGGDECSLLEYKFDGAEISGIADTIEIEDGKSVLADHKTTGSYKVQKALGFTTRDVETGEIYKTGKKKGLPKTVKELIRVPEAQDRREWELQLNKYRIEAEKQGIHIDEMKIEAIVRDGNTHMARSRGVFRNVYYFKIDRMDDMKVNDYFSLKRLKLLAALDEGHCNDICSGEENWQGLRCQRYCDVAEFCKYGKFLKQEKEVEDMAIKGLSDVRRLPRLGKIRLGVKKTTDKGVEYPSEVDYFILDPSTPSEIEREALIKSFHKLYGEQPKSIQIMFPVGNPDVIFSQFYKRYGSGSSLKCKGDGDRALCAAPEFATNLKILEKSEMGNPIVECKGKDCPYYGRGNGKGCTEMAVLQVLLPELPGAGVWQIGTGSYNSIVNLNSCIDYVKNVAGRIHMIPLQLERREQETIHEGKKSRHFTLQINLNVKLAELQRLATIDVTQAAMLLPEPDVEKEDVEFNENRQVELPTPAPAQPQADTPPQAQTPKDEQAPDPKPAPATGATNALKAKRLAIWGVWETNAKGSPLSFELYEKGLQYFMSMVLGSKVTDSRKLTEMQLDMVIDAMTNPKTITSVISQYIDSNKGIEAGEIKE